MQEKGFENHQIVKRIPDMRPIIDTTNMPVHLQLHPEDDKEVQVLRVLIIFLLEFLYSYSYS
jgi:hypothetical protein